MVDIYNIYNLFESCVPRYNFKKRVLHFPLIMRNLEDFQLPADGEIILCEINGRMQSMNREFANISTFTNTTEKHPQVHITRDILHNVGLGDEGRALFLPTDVPFLKQLTQIYTEQGFLDALHAAYQHPHLFVSNTAFVLLSILGYYRKVEILLNPSLQFSGAYTVNEYSQTRNWANNTVRCLAWQPHTARLALATGDDSVRIYCNESAFVPLLRCKRQKSISCLAWRPKSLTELAVGHAAGVIVWNVDFSQLAARPSVTNTVMLSRPGHTALMSLAWSPLGDVLASAAANDPLIHLWDVELNKTSRLQGARDCGNVLLKWSPEKRQLLSVSNGIVFKIWNCHNWESERWTVPLGRVQSACWSNCGKNLLFATSTETIIYGLTVKNDQVFTGNNESMDHALPLFDVSKVDLDGVIVGGLVQAMETDPKGNYLAVFFKEASCVAVFNLIRTAYLQLIPSSLIMGLASEVPSTICFQQNFKSGACLTIGWSSGRLQHFPIVVNDMERNLNISGERCIENSFLNGTFNVSR